MDFKDYRKMLIESANAHFTRVGRKMMWTYQPGEVTFLIPFYKDSMRPRYDFLMIYYSPAEWFSRPTQLLCGFEKCIRRIVEKDDLDLIIDYPGTRDDFYSLFFDSYLGTNLRDVNYRLKFPLLKNLEARRADYDTFFATLKQRLDELDTFEAVKKKFELPDRPEFYEMIRNRIENCDK